MVSMLHQYGYRDQRFMNVETKQTPPFLLEHENAVPNVSNRLPEL